MQTEGKKQIYNVSLIVRQVESTKGHENFLKSIWTAMILSHVQPIISLKGVYILFVNTITATVTTNITIIITSTTTRQQY